MRYQVEVDSDSMTLDVLRIVITQIDVIRSV
jgi:hypothetical protein